MKSTWIAIVVILSAGCLIASQFLLPSLQIGETLLIEDAEKHTISADTLALQPLGEATFERLVMTRHVQPGDTLGLLLLDQFVAMRDSLLAFAKTGVTSANWEALPLTIKAEILSFVPQRHQLTQRASRSKTRYVLRGVERDYLAAEIMGAEDASTELIGKLGHMGDAGLEATFDYKALHNLLKEKQRFIASAKRKLAQKETTKVFLTTTVRNDLPTLSDAQRARILTFSRSLPVDTQHIFAPIAGRYYRPDDGVGYIISESSGGAQFDTESKVKRKGYMLQADGSPILWGTAQRNESKDQNALDSNNRLQVTVE